MTLGGGITPSVRAEPPTDDDVRSAQQDEQAAGARVAQIEADLATLAEQRDDAWIRAGLAAEDYADAQAALDAARLEVDAAQSALTTAEAGEAESRSAMGAVYRASRQSGGSLDALQVVVESDGLDQIVESERAQKLTGRKVQTVADGHRTARALADAARARASAAEEARVAASERAEETFAAAQEAQQAIEGSIRAAATRRDELIADLAAARATTVEVERARQDALDAERELAAERQAQAERDALAVPTPSVPEAGTPAPPSGGGSAPVTPPVTPPAATPDPPVAPPVTPPVAPPVTPPVAPPVTPPVTAPGSGAAKGQGAVDWARTKIGAPYLWGGNGPAYDCSGLTSQAWASVGVSISRTSRSQYAKVAKIGYDQLRPGDLIFYGSDPRDAGSIWHVAMYVGNGQMIEAIYAGVPVKISAVRYKDSMPYAGRP